jgi:MerR family transcriptional regulator, copper efflux regulator
MQIGELAQRAAVSTKTIRYYEQIGLLAPPPRAPNGYRDYGDEAVDRLRFIRDSQSTGLTLTEIVSILEMRDEGETTCDHVADLLKRHLVEIERQIEALHRTRDQLRQATERAISADPRHCTDPNRCQTIEEGIARQPSMRAL